MSFCLKIWTLDFYFSIDLVKLGVFLNDAGRFETLEYKVKVFS